MHHTVKEKNNRVLFWGAGDFLRSQLDHIFSLPNTDIIGIADNNKTLYGTWIKNCQINPLEYYSNSNYDYIVITSTYACDIINGLIKQGIPRTKVLRYREYLALVRKDDYTFYDAKHEYDNRKKKILLITPEIVFSNGATMAGFYLLQSLISRNYSVAMAATTGDKDCIEYFVKMGISVHICISLEFRSYGEMDWMHEYDTLIVNTYSLSDLIMNLACPFKVIWWLHETDYFYDIEIKMWGRLSDDDLSKCYILCVSKVAQSYFKTYYPNGNSSVMEYGIPCVGSNKKKNELSKTDRRQKIVFALIGDIYELKGQDIFLQAIEKLECDINDCEFWLVGRKRETAFCRSIIRKLSDLENVRYLGVKTSDEIKELYRSVDVVVSASRRDMLPIVITEAMLYEKLIIIPDSIGTIDYVRHNEEALVFKTEDVIGLKNAIELVIQRPEMIEGLGKNARKVYQKHFSLEALGDRIEEAFECAGM